MCRDPDSTQQATVTTAARDGSRRRAPVVAWAALGALALALEVWVLARWALDSGLHPIPDRGSVSGVRGAVLWIWQALVVSVLAASAWYAVRTCRREGRMSMFAALFVGYLTAFWLDPLANLQRQAISYTDAALHVVAWGPYLPG